MPELPEVERARKALETLAKGKTILRIEANDDPIVFSGCTAASFSTSLLGKTVKEVKRKGKNFYMVLSSAPHPIFHFGMSGNSHTRGLAAPVYRVPRAQSDENQWPPKYTKTTITFADEEGKEWGEWAFSDPRRLGRIKLVEGEVPEMEEPLCLLGADPLLDMPVVDVLEKALAKRHAPIKAVLLDQYGPICGIGNWMVDEILYQARIHPTFPSSSLSTSQVTAIHNQVVHVTTAAVEVNADASRFPSHWLFAARWGKGKKGGKNFTLPNGEVTTITYVTVGGRTSAVVDSVQVKAGKVEGKATGKKRKVDADESQPSAETSPHFSKKTKVEDALLSPTKFKLPASIYSPPPVVANTEVSRRTRQTRSSRKT